MSRLPQPSSSRIRTPTTPGTSAQSTPSTPLRTRPSSSSLRPPSVAGLSARRTPSPTKSAAKPTTSPATPRVRTKSTPKPPPRSPVNSAPKESPPPTPRISIKDAIALKRAEAKKAQEAAAAARGNRQGQWDGLEDVTPENWGKPVAPEEDEGRPSIRDTIERARTSGTINLSSRSLSCLPSALFAIHLGIEAAPLDGVDDPPLPEPKRPTKEVSWFEQRDLEALKAWNNDIVAIQPEIALFGSLKFIDLHANKLTSLPDAFGDLSRLTSLDLSHNALASLPSAFFALPALSTLDLSHNSLTALPFDAPFTSPSALPSKSDYFAPAVVRADRPLPSLTSLNASYNSISVADIHLDHIPPSLHVLDLSFNTFGNAAPLFAAAARLPALRKLCLAHTRLSESAFPSGLLADVTNPFPELTFLDLEESFPIKFADAVRVAFEPVTRDVVLGSPGQVPETEGTLGIVVGKKEMREAWELEADRRAQMRRVRSRGAIREDSADASLSSTAATKARQGDSAATKSNDGNSSADRTDATSGGRKGTSQQEAKPIVREQWEIDAEQGLLTEGGRRRARALAAAAASAQSASTPSATTTTAAASIIASKYYHAPSQTLTLPALAPLARTHSRAFSLHTAASSQHSGSDVLLPTATLPYALIAAQPFAANLRVLEIRGRRADVSFLLGSAGEASKQHAGAAVQLERVETLVLEACGLSDTVSIVRGGDSDARSSSSSTEGTLQTIMRLFPGLRELDLSYNLLENIDGEVWKDLATESGAYKGLRALRLRGNRVRSVDALGALAGALFAGDKNSASRGESDGRVTGCWILEELDLRENEVQALPPSLGLLPLDALLVEGNAFRIPPRRVWEREGSRGLLLWLQARMQAVGDAGTSAGTI